MIRPLAAGLTLAAATLSALPAAALSCMRPDPVMQYEQARDSEDRFRIVHGALTPLAEVQQHEQDLSVQHEREPITIPARLQGMQLGANGFSHPFDQEVEVQLVCFGPWCGGWPGEEQMLFSVQETDTGALIVTADPCGSRAYHAPTEADLARVTTCHKGGACEMARP